MAVNPPSGLTASRADLVAWWRWRYAALDGKRARVAALFVQALSEAQCYRAVVQAVLDALHELGRRHNRLRDQHRQLRDEYRSYRERVLRDDRRPVS